MHFLQFDRVMDGNADAGTFMGWRVFHMNCHSCHGIGAVGTDIAPNLTERVKNMEPDTFANNMLKCYRIVLEIQQATVETGSAARRYCG